MQKEISSTITPLSGFVPQIFFDLIARVAPGAFLLFLLYFLVFKDPQNFNSELNNTLARFKQEHGAKTILFFSFIFTSYITAVVLEGVYHIIKNIIDGILSNRFSDFLGRQISETKEIALKYIKNKYDKNIYITGSIFPDMFIMYDSVRLLNPGAGSRLVKLRAEYYMARVLVIGFIILAIINLFNLNSRFYWCISVEFIFVFLIITFVAMFLQRRKKFLFGVHNHWILLNEKEVVKIIK